VAACSITREAGPKFGSGSTKRAAAAPVRDAKPVAGPAAQHQAVRKVEPIAAAVAERQTEGVSAEPKFAALRPVVPADKPKMAMPAAQESAPSAPPAGVSDSPIPPEGLLRYDSVTVAPDDTPDVSELDPDIPLNMKGATEGPEWLEEFEKAIRDQARVTVPRGADVGPDVDISAPGTPSSRLLPAVTNEKPGMQTDSFGASGSISFQGYPASAPFGVPPDISITVGKDHVIAGYNSYFHIYTKSTGASAGSFNMSTLFSGLPNCATATLCDPQVVYDDFNGGSCPNPTDPRYILVALAAVGTNDSRICIAVSKSGAAPTSTGNFWKYEFDPAGTGLADYEKVAVTSDALVMGYNWFGTGLGYGCAISKSNLYAGTTPTTKEVTFGSYYTPWPAVRVGCKQAQTPTYSGSHWVTYTGTSLQMWRWPTPTLSNSPAAYGGNLLSATSCTNVTGAYILAAGAGCTTCTSIDCFAGPWMDPEQRGDYLYAIRNATGGAGSAIQWAKINVSGSSPSTSSGTVSETGNFLWMGSIASDRNYDFGIAFSKASQTNSIRASAYVAGNEGGVWGSSIAQVVGTSVYNEGGSTVSGEYRWGDYSGFAPDPEDGCTLWANGQYSKDSAYGEDDASWISTYKFTGCTSAPQAFLSKVAYSCYQSVQGSIIDMGGTPTNAVYHSTTGGSYPATISGGPNTYTVSSATISQLGAVDGDSVWLTFTGSDASTHSSSNAVVGCATNVCISKVDTPAGGCDGDAYLDRGEVVNLFVQFQNNEAFPLPTGFKADIRVDPSFPDANITIVTATAEWNALDVGATGYPVGIPFQVKCTGGTDIRTVHFEVYNIRATDGSWTGGSGCSAGNLKFTEVANASTQLTSYSGFPESFDSTTFPPTNWAQADVTGTALNWARSTNTSHPASGGTHSGAGLAFANAWTDATVGDSCRLQRSANTATTGHSWVNVNFWMFHDTQYSTSADSIQVQVSTDGSGTTWTSVGDLITRPNLYGGLNQKWAQHSIDVSSVAANKATVRIGLLATTQYGNDIHVDDVNFGQTSIVADTATCPTGAPNLALFDTDYGYGYFLADPTCNANLYADAGESGTLLVYISNTGTANADGVTATLTCPSCPGGVQICKNTANYGTIPYGTSYSYSQPDNGFEVAIPAGLAAGTALPWVVTVSATNPYSTTINIPTVPAGQSRSGTYTWVDNSDPNKYSIADYFTTAPGTAGTNGRYGFSTAWTTSGTITNPSNTNIGSNVARIVAAKNTSGSMTHNFSTVGINGDVRAYWYFNMGRAATNSLFFFEWDNGDGAGFRNFIPGGTGLAGAAAGTDQWTMYGYYSLYWITYNSTVANYGPTAANAMLNNANFAARFRVAYGATAGSSTNYWEVWPLWLDELKWVNTATTCDGSCIAPEAAVINEVRDVDPCNLTGVQVYFDKGVGTVSTNLYQDAALAVTGYTSGTTYSPGDSASHNYTIAALNSFGTTTSTPSVAGTDGNSTGQTFTCAPVACTDPTAVLLTAPAGFGTYTWKRGAATVCGSTNTCSATATGSYTVSYPVGGCTTSPAQTVTIGGTSNPGSLAKTSAARLDKSGSNIVVSWSAPGGSCTPTDYGIYEGTIGTWYSHSTAKVCTDASSNRTETFAPASGDRYYIVVPITATQEGSYGTDSDGAELPVSSAKCKSAQNTTSCN
jgi:hypothetical protein